MRGKWALGITPRHFTWILKDKLAICERPGGYGDNHRRVRRQEEIIWIRENGFGCVISIIPAPHNLHNYEELSLPYRHRPYKTDDRDAWLRAFYREIDDLLRNEGTSWSFTAKRSATASSGSWAATSAGRAWSKTPRRRSRSPSVSPAASSIPSPAT